MAKRNIEISTDKERLDVVKIHQFLTQAYWSKGRTLEEVKKSIEHCLCFGVFLDTEQIGFARVATDYTVFAYLMDVFILPEYRGNGYAKVLVKHVTENKELKGCKIWMLKTLDAHGLYTQFGFNTINKPQMVMERIIK